MRSRTWFGKVRRRSGFLGALLGGVLIAAPAWPKDNLAIGVSQFPSSMHPHIDPELVKSYIEGFALRPVTAFGTDWKNGCLLCTGHGDMAVLHAEAWHAE